MTSRDGNQMVELIYSDTLSKAGEKRLIGVMQAGTEILPKYAFYACNEDVTFLVTFLDAEEQRAGELIAEKVKTHTSF